MKRARARIGILVATILATFGIGCGESDDDASESSGTGTTERQKKDAVGAEPPDRPAGRGDAAPQLSGNREAARAGVVAMSDFYSDLTAAATTGVAATDVSVSDTLDKAADVVGLGSACGLMAEEAKRETIAYAKRSSGYADVAWTCEKAMALLLRRVRRNNGLARALGAEVVGVNAEGNRATATLRFGERGRLSTMALVREDGRWKLAASLAGRSD